jgi:hypothetical protein
VAKVSTSTTGMCAEQKLSLSAVAESVRTASGMYGQLATPCGTHTDLSMSEHAGGNKSPRWCQDGGSALRGRCVQPVLPVRPVGRLAGTSAGDRSGGALQWGADYMTGLFPKGVFPEGG